MATLGLILGLWLFRWYVHAQHTDARKAAAAFGAMVAVVQVVSGRPLGGALLSAAIAGIALWLLVWVDGRFHSLITIPIWFVATMGLWALLNVALL